MTAKEKERLGIRGKVTFDMVYGKDIEIGNILAKEIANYLKKNGYEVAKSDFQVIKENGYPTRIEFHDRNFIVSKFSFLTTDAADKWIKNSESLFKTSKASNVAAIDDRFSGIGRTFKDFLKEIKTYCMRENRYEEEEDYER